MSLPIRRRRVSVFVHNSPIVAGFVELESAIQLVREGHAEWYKNRHIRMLRSGVPLRGASCYGVGLGIFTWPGAAQWVVPATIG